MEFIGIPINDEMKEHLERQEMAIESYRHDVQRLFDELPKEHLMTLRIMFNQFTSEGDTRLTSYYEGVLAATINQRFSVCGGCGKNHADELLGKSDEGTKEQTIEVKDGDERDPDLGIQVGGFLPPQAGDARLADLFGLSMAAHDMDELTPEQFKFMEEYNLDDLRDEDTLRLIGFICKGCGLQYVSIADRMLKKPDDCHGCHLKSAHG